MTELTIMRFGSDTTNSKGICSFLITLLTTYLPGIDYLGIKLKFDRFFSKTFFPCDQPYIDSSQYPKHYD